MDSSESLVRYFAFELDSKLALSKHTRDQLARESDNNRTDMRNSVALQRCTTLATSSNARRVEVSRHNTSSCLCLSNTYHSSP